MLKIFARKDTLLIIGLLVFLCVFTLVNGIVNVVFKVIVTTLNTEDVMNPEPLNITWDTFFGLHLGSLAFYGAFALIGLICASVVIYKLRTNFVRLKTDKKELQDLPH